MSPVKKTGIVIKTSLALAAVIGVVAAAELTLAGASGAQVHAQAKPAGSSWRLVWSPQASKDGLGAFEGVEDDRAGSDPGHKHIYVQGNDFRFDMPLRERDSSPDRQRNEVKGLRSGGTVLTLDKGQTWRLQWSIYIPSTLKATTSFTHIMQLKAPGTGSAPILTVDLRKVNGVPKIQVDEFLSNVVFGTADLTPLQNTWITATLEFRIGDKPNGYVTWTLASGGRTVVTATRTGVDTFLTDRVRPKWGIYRSVKDKADLMTTYMLITDMKAWELS